MGYTSNKHAILLLEDGTIFFGKSIGIECTSFGEVCFNTGMTGYQEIFTDPSYFGQILITSSPHIGNYGVNMDDFESDSIKISGLVCKNFSSFHSRPNSESNLFDYFKKHNLVGISDVDTRALVSYIRDNGAMNAVICTEDYNLEVLKTKLSEFPKMKGLELASKVSTKNAYYYGNEASKYKIAVIDLGVKTNILRNLARRDCYLKVFPYNISFDEIQEFNPDGYFLSNGPGDPEPLESVINLTKQFLNINKPLFGICLGHQIIGLANGIPTYKMFNGHRGINHPVINLLTNKGEITSQNHGFAVSKEALESNNDFEITHIHLNDKTIAGMRIKNKPCFSVQFHPESSPGPHDSTYLFDEFIEMINV